MTSNRERVLCDQCRKAYRRIQHHVAYRNKGTEFKRPICQDCWKGYIELPDDQFGEYREYPHGAYVLHTCKPDDGEHHQCVCGKGDAINGHTEIYSCEDDGSWDGLGYSDWNEFDESLETATHDVVVDDDEEEIICKHCDSWAMDFDASNKCANCGYKYTEDDLKEAGVVPVDRN